MGSSHNLQTFAVAVRPPGFVKRSLGKLFGGLSEASDFVDLAQNAYGTRPPFVDSKHLQW
jgi:hypothetical protein